MALTGDHSFSLLKLSPWCPAPTLPHIAFGVGLPSTGFPRLPHPPAMSVLQPAPVSRGPSRPLPLPAAPSPSPPRSSLLLLLPSQRRCCRRSPAALGPARLDADKSWSFPSGSRRARPISASGSSHQERPSPVTNLHGWPWALRLVWISQLGSPLGQEPCSGMPSPLAHHFPEMLIVPLRCSPALHVGRSRLSHPPRAPSPSGACGGLVGHLRSPHGPCFSASPAEAVFLLCLYVK